MAGELGARFFEVGISDVLDMYVGTSERNVAQIFAAARRSAPCVLFLDEIDALGQKRSHLTHSSTMRNVVNQLLAEMDPARNAGEGVFVLGATNHPWDVDPALRRPGRFDRMLLVLPRTGRRAQRSCTTTCATARRPGSTSTGSSSAPSTSPEPTSPTCATRPRSGRSRPRCARAGWCR